MNREELRVNLPTPEDFRRAPNYEKKEHTEAFIRTILAAIEADDREPDEWEGHDILAAIGAMAAGMFMLSLTYAERSLVPPEQRAPVWAANPPIPPTLRQLGYALDYVSGMPVPNY